jgi:glycosyltransferase involved in cell wall biosynthesis
MTGILNAVEKGEVLFAENRLDEAEQHFLSLLETDPTDKETLNNLGVIAFRTNRVGEAATYFSRALEIDPCYDQAIINFGGLLKSIGELSRALPFLEMATQRYPENREIALLWQQARIAGQASGRQASAEITSDQTAMGSSTQAELAPRCFLRDCRLALVNPWGNKFNSIYENYFSTHNEVKIISPSGSDDFRPLYDWADIVWSTWCNEPLVYLSRQKKSFALVSHIRSYEVLTPQLMTGVNWAHIDGAIFVADHIRRYANQVWGAQLARTPQTTVFNSVELDSYPFFENGPGRNIGFVAHLDFKKGIGLLVQCLHELTELDPAYTLHIAGDFREPRFEVYMRHLLKEMNLTDRVVFHGWVGDVGAFLKNMNYVISTSPWEGCPNNIIEAMACGIKPLIHNWPGAAELFPEELVFNSPRELKNLVASPYDAGSYRRYVETNFNAANNLSYIDSFLASALAHFRGETDNTYPSHSQKIVKTKSTPMISEAKDTAVPSQAWKFPSAAFAADIVTRRRILAIEADRQIAAYRHDLAETSLRRMTELTQYADQTARDKLIQLYQRRDDIPAIQQLWKRFAVSALETNQLDYFLQGAYLSIYAEQLYGKNPNYRYAVVDDDINAYVRMAARMHPLHAWVTNNRKSLGKRGDRKKLRVGLVLEGLSQRQATIRTYFPLAEYYDRERFELFVYSRWVLSEDIAVQHNYQETAEFLARQGCAVRTPASRLSPSGEVEFLAKSIVNDDIDILVYQTTYFVPPYNFLACLHPAPVQAAVCHQQPEKSQEIDLLFAPQKIAMECECRIAPPLISHTRVTPKRQYARNEFGLPDNAIVLVSTNRELRYAQPEFWREIAAVMSRHPNTYFLPIGLSQIGNLLPTGHDLQSRIMTLGYRTDVLELLQLADIYVDLFPSGGGSSVIEAMQAGLPVVCFEQNFAVPYAISRETVASEFVGDRALIVPWGDMSSWHAVFDRLLTDPEHRRLLGQNMKDRAERYEPQNVCNMFFGELEARFRERLSAERHIS